MKKKTVDRPTRLSALSARRLTICGPRVAATIVARQESQSLARWPELVIGLDLGRYYLLVRNALHDLDLTLDEALLIVTAMQSVWTTAAAMYQTNLNVHDLFQDDPEAAESPAAESLRAKLKIGGALADMALQHAMESLMVVMFPITGPRPTTWEEGMRRVGMMRAA